MNPLTAIANAFRSAPKGQKVDRYNLLSPLLATGELVASAKAAYLVFSTSMYADIVRGRAKPGSPFTQKSVQAYNDYVKHLPSREQASEKTQAFSSVLAALDAITQNLTVVEDNFQALFGNLESTTPEQNIKTSSLVVIGYLEKADNFCTWLMNLAEHMTADEGDMIPPFRTRDMLGNATTMSEFVQLNLNKWNPKHGGLFSEIKTMQSKGADLPVQLASGEWIDEFAHDNQFNTDERNLITAAIRNPILIMINWGHVKTQHRLELLTARKEWLTAKVIQEQAKLRGLDPSSTEYARLKKITDKYASLISKHEQQIERIRG